MRLLVRIFLLLTFSGDFLGAFAQETRSGFAIVTLVSGNAAGLIVTESLKNTTETGVQQTIVGPSPLVTGASILVTVGPESGQSTAIAITNPSLGAGGVNLILTNRAGIVVLNTSIRLGPHGQFARFLNELFASPPAGFSTPLLLTVSSEIPVAILALNFQPGDFASIPLTSLSFATPPPLQPFPPPVSPFLGQAVTGGAAQTVVGTAQAVALGNPQAFAFGPPVSPAVPPVTIGGPASIVFAQVATGGSWSTEIAIGNTSAGIQSVRIDFFGPDGLSTGSVTDIVIPSRGVFFFSTDPQVQASNR